MKVIKARVRAALRNLGLEIRRVPKSALASPDPFVAQRALIRGKKSPVILDVGAHKGETAARYKAGFPAARVYCFEPYPPSAEMIRNRFREDPSVSVVEKAVAETRNEEKFYVSKLEATNSRYPRPSRKRRYFPRHATFESCLSVTSIDLDGFIEASGIDFIDILKVDVQEGELDVMRGAESLLRRKKVGLIYSEAMFVPHYEGAPLFHELSDFLGSTGYTLFSLYDLHVASNGQLRYGDALFVSDQMRQEIVDQAREEP